MKKKFAFRSLIASIFIGGCAIASFTALSLAWFLGPNVDTNGNNYLDGEVGLRNYFFAGDGTIANPYEIVSPIHFYNLNRLQNLGIFPGKTYFQIGHYFDIEGVPTLKCINRYDEDNNPIYEDFLDMDEFSTKNDITTIGGEGVPFVGEIDGHGLPIVDLKVKGNPEDIGVFGYVAQEGSLKGMVFENLEITSLGYNNDSGSPDNLLFSQDIDDIFHSSSFLVTETDYSLTHYVSATGEYDTDSLKKVNGVSGTSLVGIDNDNNLIEGTKIFKGFFHPTFPTSGGDTFKYDVVSSSPIFKKVKDANVSIPGASDDDYVIDLKPLADSESFGSTNAQVNARLYLTASTVVDGHTFTRVIQSYQIEFYSNNHTFGEGFFNANVFLDYMEAGQELDKVTGYHHGINVGLFVGHLDGSMEHCYVYNGKFIFNDTGYHPVAAESDTALIGEIGVGVSNDIDPDIGLVVNGDIGVMNFSKIYSKIRHNFTADEVVYAGRRANTSGKLIDYVSYKDHLEPTYVDYIDYLRYNDGMKDDNAFITYTGRDTTASMHGSTNYIWHPYSIPNPSPIDVNSVSFIWNKVIQDEDGIDRGLGVFKIVSTYNNTINFDEYGKYQVDDIASCRIINGAPKDKVYFSTAEYDHTKSSGSWTTPMKGTTLPSYSDITSFDYPFSRDFNYLFQLDLTQMALAGENDYMYNTDSSFLSNYLYSKLFNKYGKHVEPGSPRFGFMFRSSDNEKLTQLSSYMPVKKPGDKHEFIDPQTHESRYYPSDSIVFRIENENGANVSVVGCDNDISVYSYDPKKETGGVTQLYTMKSSNPGSTDSLRYFKYDLANNGATGTEAEVLDNSMSDSGVLYGHIFYLPQGDYVLGAYNDEAKVYFLAVQGQTDGTIGAKDIIDIDGEVKDVDFLLDSPSYSLYPAGLSKALFSFSSLYNTVSGELTMDVQTVGDKKYMRLTFLTSPTFVLRIFTYNRQDHPTCNINGVLREGKNYEYLPS